MSDPESDDPLAGCEVERWETARVRVPTEALDRVTEGMESRGWRFTMIEPIWSVRCRRFTLEFTRRIEGGTGGERET